MLLVIDICLGDLIEDSKANLSAVTDNIVDQGIHIRHHGSINQSQYIKMYQIILLQSQTKHYKE